jgi:hypothetical protein
MPSGDDLSVISFLISVAATLYVPTLNPEIRGVRAGMRITAIILLLVGVAWPFLVRFSPAFAVSEFARSMVGVASNAWAWFILLMVALVVTSLIPTIKQRRVGLDLTHSVASGSSQSPSEYADRSRYRGTVQWIVLGVLLVSLAYVYSLLHEIQREAECYLFPRRLTTAQRVRIGAHLKEHDAYDITLRLPAIDREVDLYAKDFERAFANGDWTVKYNRPLLLPDGAFPERGVSLSYTSNEKTQREEDDPRRRGPSSPGKVASEALGKEASNAPGGLRFTLGGSGVDLQLADGVYKIVLTIGPRPYSLCQGNTDRK